jgi:hypothetical protein
VSGRSAFGRRVRWGGWLAAVALGGLVLPGVVPAASLQPSGRDLSIESSLAGTPETALSGWAPSASDDGRFVAYVGPAADGRELTVYLRDRAENVLRELTVPGTGVRPGNSTAPVVSPDGCTVTVITEMAFDLFRDDDRFGRWDVYRTTLPHCGGGWGEWELVSTGSQSAVDGVSPYHTPAVSASGQVVAFVVPDNRDAPTHGRLTVVDLTVPLGGMGRVTALPGLPDRTPTGPHTYVGQAQPSISADGQMLAFTTDALPGSDGLPAWSVGPNAGGPARTEVAIWSRAFAASLPRVISAGPSGTGSADQPSISGDGLAVAFRSTAPDLVAATLPPCGDQGCTVGQVYLVRLVGDPMPPPVILSARPAEDATLVAGTGDSSQPSLDADGSVAVFVTRATGLVPGTGSVSSDPRDGDLLVAEVPPVAPVAPVAEGDTDAPVAPAAASADVALRRLTVRADGTEAAMGASSSPRLTPSGRVVVFDTGAAAQLVAGGDSVVGRQVAMVLLRPTLSIPALDMGTVPVNWPSPEWFVTLTNEGPGSFTPELIATEDPAFMITGGTCVPLVPVPAGSSCTVNVVFTPITQGPARTTLTIAETGFDAQSVSTIIDGAGGEPTFSARPAGVNFGEVGVGATSSRTTVDLTNTGFAAATVVGVEVFGEHPEDFEVVADRCRNRALAPTTSCGVELVATPRGAGTRSALVTFVTATGQRTSVVVSARGRYQPGVIVPPTVTAGQPLSVVGLGFPPSTPVLVSLGDGFRAVSTLTGEFGQLEMRMVLPRTTRTGQHVLVVAAGDGSFGPLQVAVTVVSARSGSGALAPALRPGR